MSIISFIVWAASWIVGSIIYNYIKEKSIIHGSFEFGNYDTDEELFDVNIPVLPTNNDPKIKYIVLEVKRKK